MQLTKCAIVSPTPAPTTTRCPIRGVGGTPYGQRLTRTRAASAPRTTLPPPAGNHPHLPTANPLLMAPPRSPETSLSEGPGEAVGKLGACVLSHAPQDSCSARAAHVPRTRARQFQRADRTPASAAALPCRTATSSITNAITSGGRTRGSADIRVKIAHKIGFHPLHQ